MVKLELFGCSRTASISQADLNRFGEAGDGEIAAEELVQQELKCPGAEPERERRRQQDLRH